jgi:predicted nucleic acid-binding protein
MAGQARYTAVLDACVFYPIAVADALISIAAEGLFAAKWTERIEAEWVGAPERDRPELTGRLEVRRTQTREAVPGGEVTQRACAAVRSVPELPDPGDAHVLTAAIAGHADCIVTFNLRDFPGAVLEPLAIEAVHPDVFIINQWNLDEGPVMAALRDMRLRWRRPAADVDTFGSALDRNRLPLTARRVRAHAAQL